MTRRFRSQFDVELVPCESQVKLGDTPMVCIADHTVWPTHHYVAASRVNEVLAQNRYRRIVDAATIAVMSLAIAGVILAWLMQVQVAA